MIYPDLPKLALSIRQPWVHSILHLGKDIENREWSTKVRGSICLHAAKGMTQDEWRSGFHTALDATADQPSPIGSTFPRAADLPRGGIVGVVDIIDCVTHSGSPWFFGRYGFVLANARPVEFIPVKGKLGFFDWRSRLEVSDG